MNNFRKLLNTRFTMIAIGFMWILVGAIGFIFGRDGHGYLGLDMHSHVHDLRLATGFIIGNLWFVASFFISNDQ